MSDLPLLDSSTSRSPKLCRLFLDQVPRQLLALEEAVRSHECARVYAEAHKLKGTCYALGATQMADAAERLESAGKTEQLSGAQLLFDQLTEMYRKVASQLELLLQQ